MFRRYRHAARVRLIEAVRDGAKGAIAPEVGALHEEIAGLRRDVEALHRRVNEMHDGLHGELTSWERRQRRDLITAADQEAVRTSAAFVQAQATLGQHHSDKFDTLRAALAEAPRAGSFLEFGVATGGTLRVIAEAAPVGTVYGFDSFEGLPEHWRPGFEAGTFAMDALPDVPGAELVVGWFEDTLPGFLEEHPEPVAFLHLDADLYSATRFTLQALADRLQAGTVILFDEYFNFPGWQEHEHRAWTEFVAETGLRFEYLGYTIDDEQVSVRLLDAPAARRDDAAPVD